MKRARTHATLLLAIAVFVGLVVTRQLTAPTWVVRGVDWDTWYLGAAWFRADEGLWPATRWPVHGAMCAFVDLITPGVPLHVSTTLTGMASLAVTTAATFDLGRRLLGTVPGLVAAGLLLTLPMPLEMGAWTSGYPLWMAATAVSAAGLAAAADDSRRGWWVAGVGAALTWGVMAKALPGALGLTGLGVLLACSRRDLRGGVAFLLPIVGLALLYAVFPERLMSLQDQVQLTLAGGAPVPGGAVLGGGMQEGYVFGQQMGPIFQTLLSAGGRADAIWNWDRYSVAFPSVWPWVCVWLGLGLLMAVVGTVKSSRRLPGLIGWTALVGIGISVAPSPLAFDPQVRFLAPLLTPVALLFVAPFAVAGRAVKGIGPAAALLAIPMAAIPGCPLSGPWWDRAPAVEQMATGGAAMEGRIWYQLSTQWPERPVIVIHTMEGGTFALDGRDGFRLGPDDPLPRPVESDDLLLVTLVGSASIGDPASTLGPAPIPDTHWTSRRVVAVWESRDPRTQVLLLETLGGSD